MVASQRRLKALPLVPQYCINSNLSEGSWAMVQTDPTFREITATDGLALKALLESSPDTGAIQIAPSYRVDAYQVHLGLDPGSTGVIATTNGSAIAAGFISFGQCNFEDHLRNYAMLGGLTVHPNHRRQGIASQIVDWRVQCARQRVGEAGVVLAAIQQKNSGSFMVAKRWCRQLVGTLERGAVKVRNSQPEQQPEVKVRPAAKGEVEAIADGLNSFYQTYNLYTPCAAASLTEWLNTSPLETPFRTYYVAVDKKNNVLAGLAVAEQYRMIEMEVRKLPTVARLLNKFLKLVPADGQLRQIAVNKVWFTEGQEKAARFLWEMTRWQCREQGNTLVFSYDPRSPISRLFAIPTWMPRGRYTYAISGPTLMNEDKLIYPL